MPDEFNNNSRQSGRDPQPRMGYGYRSYPPAGGHPDGYFTYGSFPPGGGQFPGNIPPQKPKNSGLRTFLWCLAGVLLVIGAGIIIFAMTGGPEADKPEVKKPSGASRVESSYGEESLLPDAPSVSANEDGPQISTVEPPENDSTSTMIASDVYRSVSPSIVCITSYKSGGDYVLDASGEGSGIIITEDGYIATNSHVVDDSKKTGVLVTLSDERQFLGAIVGIDKKTDLAVIKITAHELPAAVFADSDKLNVGQEVFAIGNPGGASFSNSLTKGAVSAVNRILSGSGYVKYIQTDAAINPGNSGGALINEHGQVIGMNTAKLVATDYEGMGFAIPSNTVVSIVNKLIRYGYVNDRGTLSIEGKSCNLYMSKANGVPQGMLITKINNDSPLKRTDAESGDIITAVEGKIVSDSTEFIDEMKNYRPGDSITLKLYRPDTSKKGGGYSFEVTIKLLSDTGE